MKRSKKAVVGLIVFMNIILVLVVLFVLKDKIIGITKDNVKETKIETMENNNTEAVNIETESEEELDEMYIEDTEGFDIETSYGNIQFPIAWVDIVKTEVVNENECETIQFWATLEGKEEIHIFDIIFGGEGDIIGMIVTSDSEEISVGIESYTYELDDSWTDKEKEILAAIDHDINYVLENLSSLKGFEFF